MKYNYNGLWKLLIDKNLKKKDLMEKANIASSTMAKMGKGLPVKLEVLARICKELNCNVGDILHITYWGLMTWKNYVLAHITRYYSKPKSE